MEYLANQHHIIIHFPIVLLIIYVFLEIVNLFLKRISINKLSAIFLTLGVISGIAAVLTGNLESQLLLQKSNYTNLHGLVISNHEEFASITLWYFLAVLIGKIYFLLKKRNELRLRLLFTMFSLLGFYFIYNTARLGGILVYKYGLGTNLFD